MKFKIGIDVERTQTSLCIVECEAENIEQARKLATNEARRCARQGTFRSLFPNASSIDVEWVTEDYGVVGVSDEIGQEDMHLYSADLSVTASADEAKP